MRHLTYPSAYGHGQSMVPNGSVCSSQLLTSGSVCVWVGAISEQYAQATGIAQHPQDRDRIKRGAGYRGAQRERGTQDLSGQQYSLILCCPWSYDLISPGGIQLLG